MACLIKNEHFRYTGLDPQAQSEIIEIGKYQEGHNSVLWNQSVRIIPILSFRSDGIRIISQGKTAHIHVYSSLTVFFLCDSVLCYNVRPTWTALLPTCRWRHFCVTSHIPIRVCLCREWVFLLCPLHRNQYYMDIFKMLLWSFWVRTFCSLD